jgi:hypothetical protein
MPKIYFLAIPFLLAAGISIAEADQKDIPAAASAPAAATAPVPAASVKKVRAKKAAAPALAAVPAISGASAPAAASAATPATSAGKVSANKAATPATPALTEQSMFKFGGFGTLGVTHSSMNQGDYVLDSSMPSGAGRSNEWTINNLTRAAAHVTAKFSPEVSAILQVDTEYRVDGTYRPEIEWLNVKYAFTPNMYLQVGRIALPTFMDSENRDVGYSYVWVSPPVDLYHQLSIPGSDGVDFMYRSEIGEAGNTLKVIYGGNTEKSPNRISTSKNMWGLFDTLEYGPATFHASYQQRISSTKNLQTGISGAWINNSDLSVGASYDPGNWFVISEWIQRRSTTKVNAMYVSGGYRIEKFTPFLLYSQNSPGTFLQDSPQPTTATLDRANRSQSTVSMGVRWDFLRNYDFKLQYDQVRLSSNSNGYLINVPPGVILYGSRFYVISAVVDFVF